MSAGRRAFFAALAVAALGWACDEDIVAPGRCPSLCPGDQLQVVDTTFTGIVTSDSTYLGYASASEASFLLLADLDSLRGVAVVKTVPRDTTWIPSTTDTTVQIGRYDSVAVSLYVSGRDTSVHDIRVLLYRLPIGIDTSSTYADLQPYLVDSLLVDSVAIPDTATEGMTVRQRIRSGVLETIAPEDNQQVALALRVRAAAPTALSIGSAEEISGATQILWYVHAVAPRDTLSHVFTAGVDFDTFLHTPAGAVPATGLAAGGMPAARSLLRLQLPAPALDSLGLVRATLILTQVRPARGRPGESFRVSARAMIRDFGPKSIISSDSSAGGTTPVTVGDTGEVHIEITRMLRVWASSSGDSLPRSMMLLGDTEGTGMAEVVVAGRGAGAAAPRLRLTYVRPYVFGVP